MKTNRKNQSARPLRTLDTTALKNVSGGLNPQPEPPGHHGGIVILPPGPCGPCNW